ncbi:MAG: glycoside hydrolase family 2 protein [Treponema sp.]|nr:glycoside hydrolase family 2 protein [Treponema sp.]
MEKINLNDEWLFTPEFKSEVCAPKIKSASLKKALQKVRIPHSVATTPLNYFNVRDYQMISGYRRVFKTEKEWEAKRVFVTFMAAAHEATVFINGKELGTHSCGYTSFKFEITKFLLPEGKENVLAVKLNSREDLDVPPFGFVIDYMTYGGIYREVFLEVANENFIDDVFVSTSGTKVSARISLDKKENAAISLSLCKAGEKKSLFENSYDLNDADKITAEFDAENVALWSPENPSLYVLKVQLKYGTKTIDEKSVRFGFRDIKMTAEGLFLNGERLLLRGMDRHQSFAHVGYAMPASLQRYDADLLKDELGLNAVRTSHYPQSQDFIDRCDECGLLVFTEIPGWQHIGKSKAWRDQCLKNVEEMVLQYRNHPSVFLWGVRINESVDCDELYEKTNALCRSLDPTRPTGGVRCIKKSHLLEDVYTYNDFSHGGNNAGCVPKSTVTPNPEKPYLISEYCGHIFPTKIYDDEAHRTEHAVRHANVINDVAVEKGVAGAFAWVAFDYNTHKDFGSGDGVCYHGVMDMYRNPKLAAAVYKSQQEKVPVLEVSTTMDMGEHAASVRGKNWIFTNADSVKMYLGKIFIAEFKKEDSPYKNIPHGPLLISDYVGNRLVDEEDIPEKVAEKVKVLLNAIAFYGEGGLSKKHWLEYFKLLPRGFNRQKILDLYGKYVGNWGGESSTFRFDAIKDGKVVKTVLKGAVESISICAEVSSNVLREDSTWDAAEVRLSMRDQSQNVLPYFSEPVEFSVTGPIEIIGQNLGAFRGGVTGVYVRTVGKKGKASLVVKCAGLEKKIDFAVK